MTAFRINVDTKQVERLGFDFRQLALVGLTRVTQRGEQLLRQEVPKRTHNLERGVSSNVNPSSLQATLNVAARTGRLSSQGASLHLPSGRTVEIDLRSRPAYDYAEAVARGTGVYGPKRAVIRPTRGKALLIPITGPPPTLGGARQAYITSGGQVFILRRYSKGRQPDPYDVRAAERLEREVEPIFQAVVEAFANQEL